MNEEAIKDAYQLFVNNGYTKSIEEFKVLMSENENARKDMFDLFVSEGYKKTPEDFNLLMGVGQVKKKKIQRLLFQGKVRFYVHLNKWKKVPLWSLCRKKEKLLVNLSQKTY